MELSRIEELTAELPEQQRKAILKLIDLKTEQDMKEIMKSNEMLRVSIDNLKESLNEKVNHLESKNDAKFTMLFWALGVILTIIVALKIFA